MTKVIAFIPALLFSAIFNYSSGMSNSDTLTAAESRGIANLIINAGVNIMLVNNDKATRDVAVDNSLRKFVTLTINGDTMVINAAGNKNKIQDGVIYIPANQLRKIQINSEAHIRSVPFLQIPYLDVIINGSCNFAISNIGKVNLIETADYTVDQTTETHHWPADILVRKNY